MAVLEARADEQALAKDEARRVAEQVAIEKKAAELQASQQQERALDDQRRHMKEVQQQALEEQWKDLDKQFEGRLSVVCTQYQAKLDELQSGYDDQRAKCMPILGGMGTENMRMLDKNSQISLISFLHGFV